MVVIFPNDGRGRVSEGRGVQDVVVMVEVEVEVEVAGAIEKAISVGSFSLLR